MMTRDGLSLQRVTIGRMPRDQELPYAKKPVAKSRSPEDILAAIAEDLGSNPNVQKQEIIKKGLADVGGHPGVKLVYLFQTKNGLIMKGVQYGVALGDWYYYLIYEAAARYYFERDHPTFEKIKDSFQIGRGQ